MSIEDEALRSHLKGYFQGLDDRFRGPGPLEGISTAIRELDGLTGGYRPGEVVLVAGPPNSGRSLYCRALARRAGVEARIPTLFVSGESRAMDVAEELLCAEAGIPLPVLRKAEFSHQDMSHLTHAADRLAKRPVEIHAPRTLSDSEVKRRILAFAAKSFEGDIIDRKLVIIDDVQEMTMEGHQCSFCGTRTSGYAGALRETIADTNVTIVAAVRLDDTTRHTSRLVPGMPWPWDANHDADLVLSLSFSEEEASLVGAKLCAEFYRNPAGIMGSLEVSLEALNGQRFPTWMAEGMDGD